MFFEANKKALQKSTPSGFLLFCPNPENPDIGGLKINDIKCGLYGYCFIL